MTPTDDDDRTASLMTPAKLAQLKVRPAPAASPAAWLDQMAADAGSGHVRRLADLRQQLEAVVRGREGDFRGVSGSCQALHDALGQLDFGLVERKGWLARATGKGKEASATFKSLHVRVHEAADDLVAALKALKQKQVQLAGTDRVVVEIEAEARALERIMDQGARWLQDMRSQLKVRQAESADAAVQQQVAQDNARCELLFERLKMLRAVNTAAHQALERCKGASAQRGSVMESLQQALESEWKAAAQNIDQVADEVAANGSASDGVQRATRAAEAAQAVLKQAAQDCATAQAVEQSAADELAALRVPLEAAA